jgi:hypothetical protein
VKGKQLLREFLSSHRVYYKKQELITLHEYLSSHGVNYKKQELLKGNQLLLFIIHPV